MSPDYNQLDNFFTLSPKDRDRKPRWKFVEKIRNFFPSKQQFYYLPKVLSRLERYLILILMLVMLASLVAVPLSAYYHGTQEIPDYGGSWTEGMVGTPVHINPLLLQTNDVDGDLSHLLFAGLLSHGANGALIPELAESYAVSDDGLQYTFTMRPNLKWHDGNALTADDVVFTIITAQNGDYGSTQRINWQGVDVSKKDDRTVVFTLKNRYAQFINNATIGILPKHVWENTKGANFAVSENNLRPVGSGPYQFAKLSRNDAGTINVLELHSFEHYALGRPYIDTLRVRFYESEQKAVDAYLAGEVDGLSAISVSKLSLVASDTSTVHQLRLPRYFALFFNQNRSRQLSDKQVRLALMYGTDKRAILERVLGNKGTLVDSPLLPGIISLPDPKTVYTFDLEKAKATLDQAGWTMQSDGIRAKDMKSADGKSTESVKLELEITTSNWPELGAVASMLNEQWTALGAHVTITTLSVPEIQQAIKERNYSTLLFGEVLGLDPDPFSFWHSSQKKDQGYNLALYDDKNADKLLEDARLTLDADQRKKLYDQLQNTILEDLPALFLYSPDYLYLQPSRIKNNDTSIIAIPSDRFDGVEKWYIDTKREKR